MDLERRTFGGVFRAWQDKELGHALLIAREMDDNCVEWAMELARFLGLRIHEVARLNRNQLSSALKKGFLRIKGKDGKVREIPLSYRVTSQAQEVTPSELDTEPSR